MYFFEETWIVIFVGDEAESITKLLTELGIHWEYCDNKSYVRARRP